MTEHPPSPDKENAPASTPAAAPSLAPGLLLVAISCGVSLALNQAFPFLSSLVIAIVLGVAVRNLGWLSGTFVPGTRWASRRLLRAGVVLLGLQLSVQELAALGSGELLVILATVVVTYLGTLWLGSRLGVGRRITVLVATGFAICGASAVAAMSSVVDEDGAEESDVPTAIALVTLYGTIALLVLPLLRPLTGLGDREMGLWIGASVHEVAQVVAAAAAVSATALAIAVVVKLARVVLLAPLVAVVGVFERRRRVRSVPPSNTQRQGSTPIVPLFVVGFLGMVVLRSMHILPDGVVGVTSWVTSALLTAAMFGLGTGVHVRSLVRTGPRALVLGAASTLLATGVSLVGIYLLP